MDSFVGLKLLMGIQLLSYATRRRAGMEARAAADVVNDFGRDPIGEGKEEQVSCALLVQSGQGTDEPEQKYNRDLKSLLDNKGDDATRVPDIGERAPGDKGDAKRRPKLEELTRFTMVKRIW